MKQGTENRGTRLALPVAGLAGWLLQRFRGASRARPRLELVERIALAPRQSLALIEAEGRRFLVATSPEGAPAFYPLDGPGPGSRQMRPALRVRPAAAGPARVSW